MKRTLLFGSLLLLTGSVAMTVPNPRGPSPRRPNPRRPSPQALSPQPVRNLRLPAALFNWRSTTHDFGRIARGKPVTAGFTFVNKGELPLVISQAKGSCGCTGVEYPKEAIMPGGSGQIKATFNAAAGGAFNKSVVVESNAEGGTVVLYVKGEVVNEAGTAQ